MDRHQLRAARRNRYRRKCSDCANTIFNETWGEFKCIVRKVNIQNPDEPTTCRDFKKKASAGNS